MSEFIDFSKPVPIEAFFGNNGVDINTTWDVNGALASAHLIIGVDVMSRHEFLLYGRNILRKIERTGKKPKLIVLRIELDQDTDELEKAIAMVQITRGRHDYNRV